MSAGLPTPLITFTSFPDSYIDTVESFQLDTYSMPSESSTPSNPPGPVAMTVGAASPGFQPNTYGPLFDTTINRPVLAAQVMPLGPLRVSPWAATLTLRSGAILKIRSGPGCDMLNLASKPIP